MSAKVDARRLAREERVSLAELLADLRPEEWERTSLCADWSVRQVAIHVVSYDELGWAGLPLAFLRGAFRVDSINAQVLSRYEDLDSAGIVDLVRRSEEPRGLTSAMGGAVALTDGLIHQQDIRRALDRPRSIPAERITAALAVALKAPTVPARKNTAGLRLMATDIDWSHGRGDEVTGPAEALLMAAAGRSVALSDLSGPGLSRLRGRGG